MQGRLDEGDCRRLIESHAPEASPGSPMNGEGGDGTLQDRILVVATELFIRHGYKGVSFLGIARKLGITHSNIHYYFRTKAVLAEAVVEAYVAGTTADFRAIWTNEQSDLRASFIQSRDWIWRQYVKFNPGGVGGQDWGLLARFVGEADLLTPVIRKTIRRTLEEMESLIAFGIELAVRRGELSQDAPKHALVMHISSLLHTSRHITRIEGNFQRLDELLRWTFEVIQRAYGTRATGSVWPAAEPARSNGARSQRRQVVLERLP